MNNRPTKVVKTDTGDHTIELYTYITAREKANIDRILAKEQKLGKDPIATDNLEISASVLMDFTDEIVKTLVKSVDGNTTNPFDILQDLESAVMDEVRPEAQKVYDSAVSFQARSSKK